MDLFQIQISHLFSSESVMSNIRISLSHGGVKDVQVRKLKTSMGNLQEFCACQVVVAVVVTARSPQRLLYDDCHNMMTILINQYYRWIWLCGRSIASVFFTNRWMYN